LNTKSNECEKINETRYAVMTYGVDVAAFSHKDVGLDYSPHILKELLTGGNEIIPLGVFIAYESPIDAEQKIEEENVSGNEMHQLEIAHNEQIRGFLSGKKGWRITNVKAGGNQGQNAQGIEPVIHPNR
jgi:hypothetical protein